MIKILVDDSINETQVIKFGRKALNLAGNLLKVIRVLEGRLHTQTIFSEILTEELHAKRMASKVVTRFLSQE